MLFDPSSRIPGTANFTWGEALWLPRWNLYCLPTELEEQEIIKIAFKLQQIRNIFGKSITITSWLRPKAYNELIGGAKDSAHIYGMAVDFVVANTDCDEVRLKLLNKLDDLKIRMEDIAGDWVHIDNREPGKQGRFFKP